MGIAKRIGAWMLGFYSLSAFERKVLTNTMSIPAGSTLSYKELAKMSGSPRAYRAVGNIMNKNPLPILIPCHRVVASGGKIGGYAYGLGMKRLLMLLEGAKL
ncbi:MAG: MGMT family protein [Candidatus Micrarchaeota archaeon]|nr:MGMT family protein [Candidatus Micrarchaeota archaeon]